VKRTGYDLPVYEYRKPPELTRKHVGQYPVIIVGGGLGGLSAALELGSRGIEVVLLDEDNTVGAAGLSSRGICYAKRSLEIFDRFGIAARMREKGVTWNEGDVFRGEQRLYRFNLQPEGDQKFPAFVNLQQFYVEQYLVEAIQAMKPVDLRWKNRVVGVRSSGDHAEVTVETPDGRYRARCRYLIAADGAHSVVREKLKAKDAESALFEDHWCIADVKFATRARAVRKAYLDSALNDGGAIWYHQMADGVWRTDWEIGHYADPDAEATPARARKRLKKLLGPGVDFELVWVGGWRFRKRYLQQLVHGNVVFLGDAAGQHSPFGARGGNRAIADANNLAWKLQLVLDGRAHADLLETFHDERHPATREAVDVSSRSAVFIGPETAGQRAFRDAILDLAQAHPWARALVNVGRLSTAACYVDSPLNLERGKFDDAPLAAPGCAAPDGKIGGGHLVDALQGQFSVAWFGREAPSLDVRTVQAPRAANEALCLRYGAQDEDATYVFRPDGHVLARCRGIDPEFAREAIERVLRYRRGTGGEVAEQAPSPHDKDRLYDDFSAFLDATPAPERERALARLVVTLAERLGSTSAVREALALSGRAPGSGVKSRPRLKRRSGR
jgi:3-(3-hydroxy-phenyl)propionate hydroxylase